MKVTRAGIVILGLLTHFSSYVSSWSPIACIKPFAGHLALQEHLTDADHYCPQSGVRSHEAYTKMQMMLISWTYGACTCLGLRGLLHFYYMPTGLRWVPMATFFFLHYLFPKPDHRTNAPNYGGKLKPFLEGNLVECNVHERLFCSKTLLYRGLHVFHHCAVYYLVFYLCHAFTARFYTTKIGSTVIFRQDPWTNSMPYLFLPFACLLFYDSRTDNYLYPYILPFLVLAYLAATITSYNPYYVLVYGVIFALWALFAVPFYVLFQCANKRQ